MFLLPDVPTFGQLGHFRISMFCETIVIGMYFDEKWHVHDPSHIENHLKCGLYAMTRLRHDPRHDLMAFL